MKKLSGRMTALIVVVAIVFIGIIWGVRTNNRMITAEEGVSAAWAQVENVYQRRMDLIPNLVSTVKGAADFEKGTLEAVIDARAKATSVQVDANTLSEANIAAFQKAQDGLSSALSRLMVTVERYPELKATDNFRDLQVQLEGTENRITTERNKFNEVVKSYNTMIRKFPNSMIANMGGFEKKGYFTAKEGAENAPEVNFEF
ncbi:MAG: LemA family protein [Bacteroidales bacterium]|nr:LemA family protein [Bacteroidales bacterium]